MAPEQKNKVKLNLSLSQMIRHTKRMIVLVVGLSILIIGIGMIVLPGPAIIVIPIALAILATEFVWAKIILQKTKNRMDLIKRKVIRKIKK